MYKIFSLFQHLILVKCAPGQYYLSYSLQSAYSVADVCSIKIKKLYTRIV